MIRSVSMNEIEHTQLHFSLHPLLVFGPPFSGLESAVESETDCQKALLKFSCEPPSDQRVRT